ncbi:MAG: ATP-dependent zinc metalloprotease FtsH [Lachnospiraceae bacterium]|nr:ATP-dependent zinc metalloprotease FtsH [Lachnospiraceae bacterium]
MNQNEGNENRQGNQGQGPSRQPIIVLIMMSLVALFITSFIYNSAGSRTRQKITYSQFLTMVEEDNVKSVLFDNDGKVYITPKPDSKVAFSDKEKEVNESFFQLTGQRLPITYYTVVLNDDDLLPLLKNHKVDIDANGSNSTSAVILNILSFVIPLAILWVIFGFAMKKIGGGAFSVGKSNAKVYVEKQTGVTFADVAGQDEAKESLQEVVDFLHNPQKYKAIGARLPKGALLVGPPGTGKTLLAKAVAGEAKAPFFSLAGSDFVEMFVGVGASRVRDLFKEAQKAAPAIIFIDEIDAIGKSRDSRYGGGNDEREQTLNQLLSEMDGFDSSKGLLILAATNRPDVLDKALLRPGRFDRRIIVDRPDFKGRLETLKVHSKDVMMDESVDLSAIAMASAGLVGSDLANIINEGAIIAVKNHRQFVCQADLFEAFELVAVGGSERKDRPMSEAEKKTVSYHEVGHALVSALLKDNSEPVQKITIVPRTMGALGYTLQTPEEEKFLQTEAELYAKITTYMAGRAAEKLVFNTSTSGAANDIESATSVARNMVTRFGMSDTFGMMGLATVSDQYLEGRAQLTCGEETASKIDGEVNRMIKNCYDEAYSLLKEHRHTLDRIAAYLYKKETITGKEFMKLFRIIEGLPEIEEDAGVTLDPAATDPSNTISPEDEKLVEEKKEEPASEEKAVSEEEAQDVEPASEEEPVSEENPASVVAASEDNGD